MERTTALKKVRALLGPDFGYQVNPKAATREEREEAKAQLRSLCTARDAAQKALEERRVALLAADVEYQQKMAALKEARTRVSEVGRTCRSYRFTVGKTVAGLFFSIMAEGDSWEEVIEKLSAKKAA